MAGNENGLYFKWLREAKKHIAYRDVRMAVSMRAAMAYDGETFNKYVDTISFDIRRKKKPPVEKHPDGPLGNFAAMIGLKKRKKEE